MSDSGKPSARPESLWLFGEPEASPPPVRKTRRTRTAPRQVSRPPRDLFTAVAGAFARSSAAARPEPAAEPRRGRAEKAVLKDVSEPAGDLWRGRGEAPVSKDISEPTREEAVPKDIFKPGEEPQRAETTVSKDIFESAGETSVSKDISRPAEDLWRGESSVPRDISEAAGGSYVPKDIFAPAEDLRRHDSSVSSDIPVTPPVREPVLVEIAEDYRAAARVQVDLERSLRPEAPRAPDLRLVPSADAPTPADVRPLSPPVRKDITIAPPPPREGVLAVLAEAEQVAQVPL
ncbi:MAG TPA: hypothetical protein VIK91_03795, partial [Nannocystis sp.]